MSVKSPPSPAQLPLGKAQTNRGNTNIAPKPALHPSNSPSNYSTSGTSSKSNGKAVVESTYRSLNGKGAAQRFRTLGNRVVAANRPVVPATSFTKLVAATRNGTRPSRDERALQGQQQQEGDPLLVEAERASADLEAEAAQLRVEVARLRDRVALATIRRGPSMKLGSNDTSGNRTIMVEEDERDSPSSAQKLVPWDAPQLEVTALESPQVHGSFSDPPQLDGSFPETPQALAGLDGITSVSPGWMQAAKTVMEELLNAQEANEASDLTYLPPQTPPFNNRQRSSVGPGINPLLKGPSVVVAASLAASSSGQRHSMLARTNLHSKNSHKPQSSNSKNNANRGKYLELSPPSQKNPLRDDSENRPENNRETSNAMAPGGGELAEGLEPEANSRDETVADTEADIAAQLEDEVIFLVRQHNPGKEGEMLHYMEKARGNPADYRSWLSLLRNRIRDKYITAAEQSSGPRQAGQDNELVEENRQEKGAKEEGSTGDNFTRIGSA